MILSLLDRDWRQVSKMNENKDSLNGISFSSPRTWMKSHSVHWQVGLEPNGDKKEVLKTLTITGLTSLTADEISGRDDEQDVLRHKQTLFSSSWMPLWGSMKMISLPREMWLPYRSHTHLAQTLHLLHRSPLWGARLCVGPRKNIAMCSLDDLLNLPVSLRPKFVVGVVVLALQERVAHVLASQKDKGCADLSLPSHASSVHNVPTCFDQCSVVNGNVQVHISRHMKVCKMEELGESVVWREATGLVAIKTFLEAHGDVWSWRGGRERHDEAQIIHAQHRSKPKISGKFTVVHHE